MPLPEPPIASIGNRHPFLLAFRSARFRFRLRTVSHVELPAEKGSTFHGALGHVLKRQAPLSYRFLYEPTSPEIASGVASQRDLPRLFALLPPLETSTEFAEGSELSLELTFFGHAIGQLSVCLAALATLGSIGIGPNRGRFEVAEMKATAAEMAEASGPRDPTLARHIYDLHVMRAHYDSRSRRPGAGDHATRCRDFRQPVPGLSRRPNGGDSTSHRSPWL